MDIFLGIMANRRLERFPFGNQTFFFEDMMRFNPQFMRRVFIFSPYDVKPGNKALGFTYNGEWTETTQTIPHLIYDRFSSYTPEDIQQVAVARKELAQHHFLNPSALSDLLTDKFAFAEMLEKSGIATIPTLMLNGESLGDLKGLLEQYTCLYIKPTYGSRGRGIIVLEKVRSGYAFHFNNETETKQNIEEIANLLKQITEGISYIIQPKVSYHLYKGSPYDIRVLVQNKGNAQYIISGEAVRIGKQASWVSNLDAGGTALPVDELKEFYESTYGNSFEDTITKARSICLRSTIALHKQYGEFCEIAYDIILSSDKGPLILEANARPSRWSFNVIAANNKDNPTVFQKYRDVRKTTVSMPLLYAEQLKR
jgi:hypothetical protein